MRRGNRYTLGGGDLQVVFQPLQPGRGSGLEPEATPSLVCDEVEPCRPRQPVLSAAPRLPFRRVPRHHAALMSPCFCCQVLGLRFSSGFLPWTEACADSILTQLQCAGNTQALHQEAPRASALLPLPHRGDKALGEPRFTWVTCMLQVTTGPLRALPEECSTGLLLSVSSRA